MKAYTTIKTILFWDLTPGSPVKVHNVSDKNVTNKQARLLFDPENGGNTFLRNVG